MTQYTTPLFYHFTEQFFFIELVEQETKLSVETKTKVFDQELQLMHIIFYDSSKETIVNIISDFNNYTKNQEIEI